MGATVTDWSRGIATTVALQAVIARATARRAGNLSNNILAADPYFVTADWLEMVSGSGTLDLEWDSRLLPSARGFMGFEIGCQVGPIPDGKTSGIVGHDPVMTALMWSAHPDGGMFIGFVLTPSDHEGGPFALAGGVWHEGERLSQRIRPPTDGEDDHAFRWILPGFAVLAAMLSQRITVREPLRMDRAERRRRARAGDSRTTEAQVIHLRLASHDRPTEDSNHVDWSRRWIVRGHWRDQWYASEGRHKPIFVPPHVKGPDDKPLVVKRNYFVADR